GCFGDIEAELKQKRALKRAEIIIRYHKNFRCSVGACSHGETFHIVDCKSCVEFGNNRPVEKGMFVNILRTDKAQLASYARDESEAPLKGEDIAIRQTDKIGEMKIANPA